MIIHIIITRIYMKYMWSNNLYDIKSYVIWQIISLLYNVIIITTILILYHCVIKCDLNSNNVLWSNNNRWCDLTINLIKFKYDLKIYMILNLMSYGTMYNLIIILTREVVSCTLSSHSYPPLSTWTNNIVKKK
jgi:hypothetical protein